MKYAIFLDDIRMPPLKFFKKGLVGIICRSVIDARYLIDSMREFPVFISFDHDLGEDCETGYDFAKWLVEEDQKNSWLTEEFKFFVYK